MKKLRSLKVFLLRNLFLFVLIVISYMATQGLFWRKANEVTQANSRNNEIIRNIALEVDSFKASVISYTHLTRPSGDCLQEAKVAKDHISHLIENNNLLFSSTKDLILFSRALDQTAEGVLDFFQAELYGYLDRPETFDKIQDLNSGIIMLQGNMTDLMKAFISHSTNEYMEAQEALSHYTLMGNLIFLFVFILFLIPMVVTTLDVVKRFSTINKASLALADQKWDEPDIVLSHYEELNAAAGAFNRMKHIIRSDIEELQEKMDLSQKLSEKTIESERQKRLIQETRYNLLQAQINPHFLFNTLNMIVRFIQLGEDREKTADLLIATSSLLRKSIEIKNSTISLSEELKLLASYLTIQKERNDCRIEFSMEVEEGIDDILIPPFTLQPLVENSILHGLKDVSSGGKVSIHVFGDGEDVYIAVTDNGIGMDEKTIKALNSENAGSHGLQNVISRLRMTYSNPDVVRISHEEPGVSVIIHLLKEAYSA